MAESEQKTDLPLKEMPRMGRRNAIADPSQVLSDDDSFSPTNLLDSAPTNDIDPKEVVARGSQHERRNQTKHEHKPRRDVAATSSVLDGWKRLHEAKNDTYNGIERLFEPTHSLKGSLSRMEAKHKKPSVEKFKEKENNMTGSNRGTPVIPWRKQDVKHTTIAEERRKLFESFDKTSLEPPDTPQVSELTLRKLSKKNKRRKKEFHSKESEAITLQNKQNKDNKVPYANVPAKVNTRWEKNDELPQTSHPAESVDKDNKVKRALLVTEKPPVFNRAKNDSKKAVSQFFIKKSESNDDIKSKKFVTNFPASETVKNTTDKLPLTIPPKYNRKKALSLMNEAKTAKQPGDVDGENEESSSSRLYGTIPAHQKGKYETKALAGNSLKSTFLNLRRINNGGPTPVSTANNRRTSSISQLIVGRYSANILGTPVIGIGPSKRAVPPIVTTIQPPPSPFLASKISIQSQMTEIPINGEKLAASTLKGIKNGSKSGRTAPKKNLANSKKNAKTESVKSTPPPAKIAVIPTLGPLPNKYNNIYIGPYSGSDTEGDVPSSKKKR